MRNFINICFSILALSSLLSCTNDEELLSISELEYVCKESFLESGGSTIQIDLTKRNRKVLIIGIDGFLSDALNADNTPFLYSLSLKRKNYFTRRHQVENLTISGPNWSSILTGVNRCKHRVKNNEFEDNRLDEFPPIFKYIEEADSSFNTASIVHWTPINKHIAAKHADHTHEGSDQQVYNQGKEMLLYQQPIDPDILFLHFVDLDVAGHTFGFHPKVPEYVKILGIIDEYVSSLFSIIEEKRETGEDWMIFVVSDHGGYNKNHSGGSENRNINNTIFIANHPSEVFVRHYRSSQPDLAPTVLDFMGIYSEEFNHKTDGVSLIDGINNDP